jgi:F-type H+-transporting ATPase subunit epsilon
MFTLSLVTPEKKIVTDMELDDLVVPAFRGELNILPGHAPLMTTLGTGLLRYKLKGESEYTAAVISWGYCEVHPTGVNVLAETAETLEEIDRARAEEAQARAEKALVDPSLEPDQIKKFQRKLQRARARLSAGQTH